MAGERILVADDETTITELLQEVLAGEGFVVDTASDAASALECIRSNMYDVALLDFNLPDMDGVMLHRQIRQMDPELASHSVFMSGFVQSDTNLDYYTAQGGGFLAKPFDIREVVRAVREALGQDAPAD